MTENRREFIGHLTAGTLTLAALSSGFVLEGCSTSWVTTALNDLPVIVNIATTIATIVADALGGNIISPAIAAIIKTAATAVQTGLALAQQLINDYNAAPSASIIAKIKQTLVDVQAQLTQILQAAHIDNAALQATIAGAIGLAITVVTAIMSLLPAVTTGGAMRAPRAAIQPLTPPQIKAQFDAILTENGYGRYSL
jgi:hypothetical protein